MVFSALPTPEKRYYHLLIGTYTSGKSEGIYVYRFDTKTGLFSHEHTATGVTNPSFLVVSTDQKWVYAVNEESGAEAGKVSAFRFDSVTGSMEFINQQPSGGGAPCYLSLSANGQHLLVGNYAGGSLSVLPIQKNGALGVPIQTIAHSGSSINAERQEKAHVHATVFGPTGDSLYVSDLGTDKIYTYSYQPQAAHPLTPASVPFTLVEPGSGPRHLVFNQQGTYAYLVHELSATVAVFRHESGSLTHLQTLPLAESGFTGEQGGAELQLSTDGRFLYASNRGNANEITVFAVDQEQGRLRTLGRQSTLGRSPRHFQIAPGGHFLLAANQDSDTVVLFKRDPLSGLLSPADSQLDIGTPVYLCMTPVKL